MGSSRRRFKREEPSPTLVVEDVIQLEDNLPIAEQHVDSEAYRSKEIISSETKSYKRKPSQGGESEEKHSQVVDLKRENSKLKHELERIKLERQEALNAERSRLKEENESTMRELETEHQILIEGLRQEYHDIINNIKLQSKEAQLKHEEELKN